MGSFQFKESRPRTVLSGGIHNPSIARFITLVALEAAAGIRNSKEDMDLLGGEDRIWKLAIASYLLSHSMVFDCTTHPVSDPSHVRAAVILG